MAKPKNTFRVRQKIADSKRGPRARDTGTQVGSCVLCGNEIDHDDPVDFCSECLEKVLDD